MTIHNPVVKHDLNCIHAEIATKRDMQGCSILITGCAGFLGFYLMHYFSHFGSKLGIIKLIGLDNFLLGKPSWLSTLTNQFGNLVQVETFDISKDKLENIRQAQDVNYVIHAASIASPSYYRKFPLETIDANISGLRSLLDYYKSSTKLRGFLFFSSSEVYGDPDGSNIPTNEMYRGSVYCHGPRACYDESKRLGETLCWIYGTEFQMPIVVARPFNNFGPGMVITDQRLPADFARSIIGGEDLKILSDGTPTRTFCYVSDAITGYILCLTHGTYDFFNIGNDKPEISVRQLGDLFVKAGVEIYNYKGKIVHTTSDDANYLVDNPLRRCPSILKAREKLGFSPEVPVDDGIQRYLRFLKSDALS